MMLVNTKQSLQERTVACDFGLNMILKLDVFIYISDSFHS